MRRTAGLHADPARLDLRKNLMHLRPLHLPRDGSAAFALKPVNLKIVLAQINRHSDKLRHGRPPSLWRSGATFWHLMPFRWGRPQHHCERSEAIQNPSEVASLRSQWSYGRQLAPYLL